MNALTPTRFGQQPSPACLPRGTVERVTDAVAAAEEAILSAMNSERMALRAGRLMAADALHLRLRAAAHAYTDALRGARAVFDLVARNQPEVRQRLEAGRLAFGNVLKIELATLAAARAAAETVYAADTDEPLTAVA